eukprot:17832-Heterococcus_DN1.PRE.6
MQVLAAQSANVHLQIWCGAAVRVLPLILQCINKLLLLCSMQCTFKLYKQAYTNERCERWEHRYSTCTVLTQTAEAAAAVVKSTSARKPTLFSYCERYHML